MSRTPSGGMARMGPGDNLAALVDGVRALTLVAQAEDALESIAWPGGPGSEPRGLALQALDLLGQLRRDLQRSVEAHSVDIRAGVVE